MSTKSGRTTLVSSQSASTCSKRISISTHWCRATRDVGEKPIAGGPAGVVREELLAHGSTSGNFSRFDATLEATQANEAGPRPGPEVEAVAQVVTPKSMTERTTLPSFMFRKPSLMSSSLIRSEIKSSRWSRPCM